MTRSEGELSDASSDFSIVGLRFSLPLLTSVKLQATVCR